MVLGDKSFLEDDLKSSYSKAGASHVLAVSGLHVGIIFLVLNYLFGFFLKGNLFAPRFLRSVFIVALLWGYAVLTGLSPSVLRASVMFSFLQFGFLFQRPYCVYSSIVASAFVLLLFAPHLLFDVGFQLSYAAVLSILFFQPRISNLRLVACVKECAFIPSRYRKIPRSLIGWSVDLTTVSLAAQIGTIPLVLYYFHQFSCLFWLSGLFVIPLAVALIYLALSSFSVSFIPLVSSFFVSALSFVASLTNKVVVFIGELPFAVVDWVDFRKEDVVIYYIMLFFLALFLVNRKAVHLMVGMAAASVLLVVSSLRVCTPADTSVAVYNYAGRSAVNLYGRGFNIVCSSADSSLVCRQLKRFWIRQHTTPAVFSSSHLLEGGGVSVFVVDRDLSGMPEYGRPVSVDYLVVSADVRFPVSKLKSLFKYKQLIVDSSCSLATSYWWKKQCPSAHLVRVAGDYIEHI